LQTFIVADAIACLAEMLVWLHLGEVLVVVLSVQAGQNCRTDLKARRTEVEMKGHYLIPPLVQKEGRFWGT
jgi:hypothetical protein